MEYHKKYRTGDADSDGSGDNKKAPPATMHDPETRDIEHKIIDVTTVAQQNLADLMERGERIEDIQARTQDLAAAAAQFQKSSQGVERKLWIKERKGFCIIMLIVGAVGIVILVSIIASMGFLKTT